MSLNRPMEVELLLGEKGQLFLLVFHEGYLIELDFPISQLPCYMSQILVCVIFINWAM